MTTYQNSRSTRRESLTNLDRFRAGKLSPIMYAVVRPSEGSMLNQQITMELDPIAGRMVTPIYTEGTVVFVTVEAMEALKYPDGDYPGVTKVVRQKFLSGNPLFGTEPKNEISRRRRVNPRSIGGVKVVSEVLASVSIPPGRIEAAPYRDMSIEDCVMQITGVEVLNLRSGYGVVASDGMYDTAANPDFQPTPASALEGECAL